MPHDDDAVVAAYLRDGMSAERISQELGVAPLTVKRLLRRRGVVLRQPGDRRWSPPPTQTAQEPSLAEWAALGLSAHAIARRWQLPVREVRRQAQAQGVELPALTGDQDVVRARYLEQGQTCQEIAKDLAVSHQTVIRALQRAGVPRRRPGPARLDSGEQSPLPSSS